jgi:hypothetical protein
MICIVLVVVASMGLAASNSISARAQCVKKAAHENQFPGGMDLWYGIQWWGRGDVLHPVINSTTGLGQGPSEHFDPRKPTVIYCHGWSPTIVKHGIGLDRLTSCGGVHMADLWIDQGWNVGSFFWTQFADEQGDVHTAEAKIWETCSDDDCVPNHAMRWMGEDGELHPWKGGPEKSAGQIFFDSVVARAPTFSSASSGFP